MTPSSNPDSDFAAEYAPMSEPELLALARAYESLTAPAQDALRQEFARRGLEPPLLDDPGRDITESSPLVTIQRYRDLSEALVARTLLESAGIYCFLRDENTIRLDWQISNFIGGLRLQVPPEDAAAATALLAQPAPDPIPFDGEGAAEAQYNQPHCPACHSTDIAFQGSNRKAAITSLYLLALPLPLGEASWRCNHCGCHWQDTP